MAFRVGQEVECVDDGRAGFLGHLTNLRISGIYTIRAVLSDKHVLLEEITPPAPCNAFWAPLFRPVQKRKTDISVFTALLNTKSVEELV